MREGGLNKISMTLFINDPGRLLLHITFYISSLQVLLLAGWFARKNQHVQFLDGQWRSVHGPDHLKTKRLA